MKTTKHRRYLLGTIAEEMISDIDLLESRLALAVEALEYYAGEDLYQPPDDWDYAGMGGPPDIENYYKMEDVASEALAKIRGEK